MYSWLEPVAAHDRDERLRAEHEAVVPAQHQRRGRRIDLAIAQRVLEGAAATPAMPDRDSRHPTMVRSQQSMIAVRWHQPSRPQKRCVVSIAQRSFGVTRARGPALHPRPLPLRLLPDLPAVELDDAVHLLPVHRRLRLRAARWP